mmetsp:Transcript_89405/g.252935  ORF Transcript_89405/g.252935 Transcript_89405/m.252935 type:complete len:327 (-) Transcript_89405:56-1036(-)
MSHHGRLQVDRLQAHAEVGAGLEDRRPGLLERLQALVDVVLAVEQDLGLDDGHQAGGLADAGVAREAMGGLCNSDRGVIAHAHGGAPLGEARARLVVVDGALLEVVQAAAPVLALLPSCEGHQAGVHLDARDHAVLLRQVHHLFAVRGVLVEGLREQDGTAAEVAEALGAEQRLAPALAVQLGVLHADGLQAQAAGPVRLVHREDALARRGHGLHGRQELILVLGAVRPGVRGRADLHGHHALALLRPAGAGARHGGGADCHRRQARERRSRGGARSGRRRGTGGLQQDGATQGRLGQRRRLRCGDEGRGGEGDTVHAAQEAAVPR